MRRALKVLVDREVSPQLGLLKSTLLQLDSSFSERDYGASTFRDFAEKLEKQGLVRLKHSGRTTLVEIVDDDSSSGDVEAEPTPATASAPPAPQIAGESDESEEQAAPGANGNLAEGVALVRSILAEATTAPRWPMYVRQFKQFIRSARPDFDERHFGSIVDLMRACQKDGFLRLERDRQGGLRAFASGTVRANVPHGWSTRVEQAAVPADFEAAPSMEPIDEPAPMPVRPIEEEAGDAIGNVAPEHETKPKRARKAAAPRAARKTVGTRAKDSRARAKDDEPSSPPRARRTPRRRSAS